MGFKPVDVNPISSLGPTAVTPPAKSKQAKMFNLTRAQTVSVLKQELPADASILAIDICGSVNSNAATTATATITVSNNSGVVSTGTVNLLTGGATSAPVQMSNLPNLEPNPLNGDLTVTAVYAETGTASTLGGPWNFVISYVR